MNHPTEKAYWRDLESNAHLPDVQELIRQDIERGMIRVSPDREGGIRIMPVGNRDYEETEAPGALQAPSQDDQIPPTKVPRRGPLARR
jgi:hypothetical protein